MNWQALVDRLGLASSACSVEHNCNRNYFDAGGITPLAPIRYKSSVALVWQVTI